MSAESFLDSNVLLYAFDEVAKRKRRTADELIKRALRDGSGCISYQVVQEVLNVLRRRLAQPISLADGERYLNATLAPLWTVQPSPELFRAALALEERYGYSWYDSLIIAAALSAGCSRLYSEDLRDGQRIEGLTIENPFRE